MEKALYITSVRDMKKAGDGCSRVYFGAEFCQWRMPGPALAIKALDRAAGMGLGFTLVTPWVTDAGLARLRGVLEGLEGSGRRGIEVVVNDYGVLMMLKERFKALTPVLGRLLVKRKCCPRIPGMLADMPDAGREVYLHAGMEDPEAARLLRKWGVRRVELDYPLQGFKPDLRGAGLKGSLYTPYAFVTTTRHCPASFDGAGWQSFTGCRIKGCLKNLIALHSAEHDARLLMRGNTQFVESPELPPGLAAMGIDRIVSMVDVP